MSLSIWSLFKYIYKRKWLIAVFTAFCFLLASFYVDKKQTYSAKVIIQYNDKCISEGKTLDGDIFDMNEIKSPAVILNVLKELGYENKKIDSIRENISVSAVTPTTVGNLKAAKEKLGEEYQFFPKTFTITYKGNSSFEYTRDILSRVIANYLKYYSEKYLYLAALEEVDYNVNKKNFDYIEQVEQIQDNLRQTIVALSNYAKDSAGYRSPTTGLTFIDLLADFERLNEYSVSSIFAKIFDGKITKDRALLVDKYTERIEENEREMNTLNYKKELAENEMNSYVEANHKVPNSFKADNDEKDSFITQGVELDKNSNVEEQTTYDSLIISYANDSIAANNKKLDAEYCRNIIEKFVGERSSDIDYNEYEKEVKNDIEAVLNNLSELYRNANINIKDYNSYIPALHIKKLSGVGYYENLSGSLYKLIAIIVGISVSSVAAIAYEIVKEYSKFDIKKEDEENTDEEESEEKDKDKSEALS